MVVSYEWFVAMAPVFFEDMNEYFKSEPKYAAYKSDTNEYTYHLGEIRHNFPLLVLRLLSIFSERVNKLTIYLGIGIVLYLFLERRFRSCARHFRACFSQ